jgi:adenylosuccinate synthase
MQNKKISAIIGSQWGDEGKGKLVDVLAKDYDIVVRFNGGNNAGHTIIYNNEEVRLHVMPSGIFHHKQLVISQGAVFDPEVLLSELDFCKRNKLTVKLIIDYRVNIVMPYHKLMDAATEKWKGKKATGSLHLGIGYCYEDRNNRAGIRCEDFFYPDILKEKIFTLFPLKKAILEKAYGLKVSITAEDIYKQTLFYAKRLKPYIADACRFITDNIGKKNILAEGANGFMLDGNFGTYPYTVACNTIVPSIASSIGMPVSDISAIGVVKAYTTRVGGGPFPTEQINIDGEKLQSIGKEVGATSGRKRRCGWLDLNILRYAQRINKFSSLAVTKLDVLDTFSEIPVCIAYRVGRKTLTEYPSITHDFYKCKPVYKVFKGWQKDITKIRKYKDLPSETKDYLHFIEKELLLPISLISVGPKRNSNILV